MVSNHRIRKSLHINESLIYTEINCYSKQIPRNKEQGSCVLLKLKDRGCWGEIVVFPGTGWIEMNFKKRKKQSKQFQASFVSFSMHAVKEG